MPITEQVVEPFDEAALLERARAGDFGAFERLVDRHERRLLAIATHMVGPTDAEDVVQTGLLAALEHLPSFRGESSFWTWVARITTNAALKVLRARRSRSGASLDSGNRDPDGADGDLPRPDLIADWRFEPARAVERRELRRILDEAVAALPEEQRLVFTLRDVAGLGVDEAAQALGISGGNVKVRLFRARLALREKLTAAFGDASRRLAPSHAHDDDGLRARETP